MTYLAIYLLGLLGGFALGWVVKGILTKPLVIQRIKIVHAPPKGVYDFGLDRGPHNFEMYLADGVKG